MYELFSISSSSGSTPIHLSNDPLPTIVGRFSGAIAIVDARFAEMLRDVSPSLIAITADELHKSLDSIPTVVKACRDGGLTRDGRIVAIGGGIIQDIASFVASVYMRGVQWDYVPTTLLAMVDSCIGGKSSINVGPYKNLAGTFHPPASIVIAPDLVATLSPSQIASGLCEASKICYAKDVESFQRYLTLHAAFKAGDLDALPKLIGHSLACKKWFIEIDEFDRAERLLLNFAHSFGHAIESATNFGVEHGVAVGVGMLAALSFSETFHPALREIDEIALLERHVLEILATLPRLSRQLDDVEQEKFTYYFANDKKHTSTAFRPVLLTAGGRLERRPIARDAKAEQAIWHGFEAARSRLRSGTAVKVQK